MVILPSFTFKTQLKVELAIVIINGYEGTLKKVHIQDDAIILESANPMFPARVFTGVDRAVVHIVGKVIEIRIKERTPTFRQVMFLYKEDKK